MIIGLQITGIIFALLMVYMSIVHYKKGSLSGLEVSIWVIIWTFAILATVFPEILRTYARTFAVSRLFDLMTVGAFILVIFTTSVVYVKTKRIEKKIEDLIRKNAVKKK